MAEPVPDGPSTRALDAIAREYGVVVMAGLVETDPAGRFYNCYLTVGPEGFITKYRKLHTFINPSLTPGDSYNVIELLGIKAGFLICYDNNLPENVRITAMLGAEVIFMPHVTGCLPSTMPGRGTVDRALWENRERDPARLRLEFEGPKGRGWLMRWLPARAWENGVYAVFSNAIGVDDDTIKPGLAMIIDPFGEVVAECRTLGDDVVVALLTPEKLEQSSGRRYQRVAAPSCTASSSSRHRQVRNPSHTRAGGWPSRKPRAAKASETDEADNSSPVRRDRSASLLRRAARRCGGCPHHAAARHPDGRVLLGAGSTGASTTTSTPRRSFWRPAARRGPGRTRPDHHATRPRRGDPPGDRTDDPGARRRRDDQRHAYPHRPGPRPQQRLWRQVRSGGALPRRAAGEDRRGRAPG